MQSHPQIAHRARRRSSLLRSAVRSAGVLGVCLSATILLETTANAGIIYTWQGTTDGNWSDVTTPRWSPSTAYPNAVDATADFSTQNITGDITVHLDVPVTVNQLIFGDSDTTTAGGWTLDNNSSATNVLTLGGTTPTITVNTLGTAKVATISTDISAAAFSAAGTGTLVLSGLLTSGAVVTKSTSGSTSGGLSIANAGNNFQLVGFAPTGTGLTGSVIVGNTTITDGTVTLGAASAPLRIGQLTNAKLTLAGAVSAATPTATDLLIGFNDSGGATGVSDGSFNGSLAMTGTSNLTVNGNLKLGQTRNTAGGSSQAKGAMTLNTDGTLHVTSNLYVGVVTEASNTRAAGVLTITKGTVNVDGTVQVQASGDNNTGVATLTQTAGTMTITGDLNIKNARANKGNASSVTIKGTTIVNGTNGVTLSGGSTGTSGTSLQISNGGNLQTKAITINNSATSTALNLGSSTTGGTITALASNATFLSGTGINPVIYTGGITFDTNGYNIGIAKSLNNASSNTGQLTKVGAGTLTLSAVNGYSGATIISNGKLALSASGSIAQSATIQVDSLGTLDVSAAGMTLGSNQTLTGTGSVLGPVTVATSGTVSPGTGVGTLSVDNLATSGGAKFTFEVSDTVTTQGAGVNDLLSLGTVSLGGVSTITVTPVNGHAVTSGTYTFATYTSLAGDASNLVAVNGGNLRQTFTPDTTTTPGKILLNVATTAASLTWKGSVDGNWNFVGTANFDNAGSADKFYNDDIVTFDDTAAISAVSLVGTLKPGAVNVVSNTTNFAFSGTGNLAGTMGLSKSGSSTLTLSTAHAYTGATTVTGGELRLSGGGAINASSGITINGALARLITTSSVPITAPTSVVQGTIGGSGDVSAIGGVSIGAGAIVSPGTSPGSQNYTTGLTFAGGGTYNWEINDAAGVAGTNYDVINVAGFNLTADSGAPFVIALNALDATNALGLLPNFDNTLSYNWELLAADAPISAFAADKFAFALGNFVTLNDLAGGSFTVVRGDAPGVGGTDKQLWLSYSPAPVPEPASLALLAIGAALLPWRRGRNRA